MLDEFLSKRQSEMKGDAMFKAARAPASWNDDARSARFVMSAQIEDRHGDIVYSKGIDTSQFNANPICLLNHRSDKPIGSWSNIAKSDKRLEGDAIILKEGIDPDADRAANLIAAGILRSCSIGFIPKTVKRIVLENGDPTWSWEIIECELLECSIVSIPANPMALAKSADETRMAFDLIEEVLDSYAKDPRTGLIVPKAQYEAAHKEMSGNRSTATFKMEDGILQKITAAVKQAFAVDPAQAIKNAEIEAEQAEIIAEAASVPSADEILSAKKKALAAIA